MVIGAERDLIDEGRSPEYILELVLIATQPHRSNKVLCCSDEIGIVTATYNRLNYVWNNTYMNPQQ
jgi:hypothetical protein